MTGVQASFRTLRRGSWTMLGVFAAGCAMVLAPLPASAAPAAGSTGEVAARDVVRTIVSIGSGRCLSANLDRDVYTTPCTGVVYHDWYIVDGANEIINTGTGDCLSANFNNDVYTTPCSGVVYHNWRRTSSGTIVNVGTGRCLSSNPAGSAYTTTCSGVVWHEWRLA